MSFTTIHPTAVVDDNVQIGTGTRVWHFVHVSGGARIGQDCILGQNTFVGKDVHIGNRVKIQNNVSVYNGVHIADDVFLGPSCVFTNVITPRAFIEQKDGFLPTYVGKGASVGANATVLCGNSIGEYAMIAAGAVVTKDVEPYALIVGVPGRRTAWVCRCGKILERAQCQHCGLRYHLSDNACEADV